MKFGDGGRKSEMARARKMNKGAGTTSTAQSTMRALLQMRPCKDDSIKGIDLELGSTFNERWSREASVRAVTAMVKPGSGRAPRSE